MISIMFGGITYMLTPQREAWTVRCWQAFHCISADTALSSKHLSSLKLQVERWSTWAASLFFKRAGLCVTEDHIFLSLGLNWSLVTSSQS